MSSTIKSQLLSRILRAFLLVLLVGLTPLISLWNLNLVQIQSVVVIQPLLVTLLLILIISGVWLLASRSLEKAALLASVTFLFVFTFGHVYNLIKGKMLFGFSIGFVKLFIIYLVVLVILIIMVFRIREIPKHLFLYLNSVIAILFIVNLLPILVHEIKLIRPNSQQQQTLRQVQNKSTGQRDIYYIVLDAYARQDILKFLLNYDNSAFLSALKDRGFYIPPCGFSNYDGTDLTIASVLNYDFLQESKVLDEQIGSARGQLELADSGVMESRVNLPLGILDDDITRFLQPLLADKAPWRERIETTQQKAGELSTQAAALRGERNGARRALADARDEKGAYRHPEYRFDIDHDEESNARWDARLQLLLSHELQRHQELVAEKKHEWEERLKEQPILGVGLGVVIGMLVVLTLSGGPRTVIVRDRYR